VIVTPAWRKILAFLSACGIVLSLFGYIYSFFGAPVDRLLQWGLLLAPVAGALIVPIRALEHRSSTVPTHSWRGFAHGMPRWFGPVANLLAGCPTSPCFREKWEKTTYDSELERFNYQWIS